MAYEMMQQEVRITRQWNMPWYNEPFHQKQSKITYTEHELHKTKGRSVKIKLYNKKTGETFIYKSITEAAKALKTTRFSVTNWINKTHVGRIWEASLEV